MHAKIKKFNPLFPNKVFFSREHMTGLLMTFFGERKTILSCQSITNPMAGTNKNRMALHSKTIKIPKLSSGIISLVASLCYYLLQRVIESRRTS